MLKKSASSLALLCCCLLAVVACDISDMPTPHRASGVPALAENGAMTTKSDAGNLYWIGSNDLVRKIRLSDGRVFNRKKYGVAYGQGLAIDAHQRVYESFFNSAGEGGYVVLNNRLQVVNTVTVTSTATTAIALDKRGAVYAVCYAAFGQYMVSIEMFAANATGSSTPVRTITGERTGLMNPQSIAIDDAGFIYVANVGRPADPVPSIEIFAPDAKGNRAPLRVIEGNLTGLTNPVNVTLGGDGNLYVANELSSSGNGTFDILAFPSDASGNVSPIRVLQSGKFGYSVSLDAQGQMYLGTNAFPKDGNSRSGDGFAIFAPGASGDDPPSGYVGKGVCCAYRAVLEYPWYQP